MSYYLWPLGSNYNNEYMDTDDFLKNCRTVDKNSYYHTVKWRCQPGFLPFNYVANYYPLSGKTEQIDASGIFSEEGIALNPFFRGYYFPDEYVRVHSEARKLAHAGEGIRLTKLYYRINDSKWIELSPDLKYVSFDLTNNGDKVDIKATYQVWTMGNPHSPIPFMWLGDEVGVYNDGKNKFSDAVPVNPGRKHSGIINYHKGKDYNADWQLQSVSWYAPGSTMLESNWAYQNAIYFREETHKKQNIYLNTWHDMFECQKFNEQYMDKALGYYSYPYQYGWNYNYSSYNTNDTTSGWWKSPYKTRKGVWWIYEKTFTDSYVASGIKDMPVHVPVSDVSLKILPMEKNWTRTKWLDGTKGKLTITFDGPNLAFADIYAKQLVYDTEIETLIKANYPITKDIVNTIEIDFIDYPQLYRSKDIAYYIKIYTIDGAIKKYEYEPFDTSYAALIKDGVHYYNDEPSWISNIKITQITDKNQIFDPVPVWNTQYEEWLQNNELYQISWDTPKDPDGDIVEYMFLQDNCDLRDISFIVLDEYTTEYNRKDNWILRCKQNGINEPENIVVQNNYPKRYGYSPYNHALYHLSNDYFKKDSSGKYINPVKMWIVPYDGNNNNYYYGTKVDLLNIEDAPLVLEVLDNNNKINDCGEIKIHYNNNIKTSVKIKVHAFMSDKLYDKSSGSYLGLVYEGYINLGDTNITVSLYDKINNEVKFQRGHYIKYAIQCDELNQRFDPYSSNAWKLATGYHIYNRLPVSVTPFMCEDKNEALKNGVASIAWNKSLDDDNDYLYYILYIAITNRPELNTNIKTFWINEDKDANMKRKKFYKSINVGTTLPTKDFPYKLNLTDFRETDELEIWITVKDGKNSSRYLTGESLFINNSDECICTTQVVVSNAYAIDLLGKEAIDGESGFVQVCQVNSNGEQGTVKLHAICKKINGPQAGETKVFTNIATWNLNCGEWSPNTRIKFKAAFGEEWSNSEVKYYAVLTTNSGMSSYDPTVRRYRTFALARDANLNSNNYEEWSGYHIYNEQPAPYIIRFNKYKSNMHKNIYIDWGYNMIYEDFKDLEGFELIDGGYDPVVPKVFY